MNRWVVVISVIFVLVGADQITKMIASQRLASTRWGHEMQVTAPGDKSVEDVLRAELTFNSDDEVRGIARKRVKTQDGKQLRGIDRPKSGEVLVITKRSVVVIPGYFDFQYTRNPGAAFGILAEEDAWIRMPLFLGMTLITLIFLAVIVQGLPMDRRLLMLALCLIAAGAIGNAIDRMAYGWVIDFIVWKYTNRYRWPTFNLADAWIVTGTSLVFIVTIVETVKQRRNTALLIAEEEE